MAGISPARSYPQLPHSAAEVTPAGRTESGCSLRGVAACQQLHRHLLASCVSEPAAPYRTAPHRTVSSANATVSLQLFAGAVTVPLPPHVPLFTLKYFSVLKIKI